eukprot:8369274-Karenia_brevis.AAC.1
MVMMVVAMIRVMMILKVMVITNAGADADDASDVDDDDDDDSPPALTISRGRGGGFSLNFVCTYTTLSCPILRLSPYVDEFPPGITATLPEEGVDEGKDAEMEPEPGLEVMGPQDMGEEAKADNSSSDE